VNVRRGVDADDPSEAIRTALMTDPRVLSVELVGSRAAGMATVLSDWDYRISSTEPGAVATQLPLLVAELRPLARLWDPLATSPVFMVVLAGAVKADLLPGARPNPTTAAGGRTPRPELHDIDAHFWDWNLWLGAKRLRGQDTLVRAELGKMWRHLLRPLGAAGPPATQQQAIILYLGLRPKREQQLGQAVSPDLGNAVITRLQAAGLLPSPLPSA
jgi:hypothetical protein